MLKIEGKTFMNIQEAVQWLLDNNALPFQCSANYQANTEIGLGTIVNPSPAKVRIGSLIFFADSKVSTVVGITETGFICSDQYNNLVDDIAYVTNISINASGHLITTLSDGQTIDAGIVKQVSGFNINASQHLIVSYNDGTTTDLGAIFTGNVNIAGNFTADSIIENMTGYSFTPDSNLANNGLSLVYVGVVKNGNKLTFAIAGEFDSTVTPNASPYLGNFGIPSAVGSKLFPMTGAFLDIKKGLFFKNYSTTNEKIFSMYKNSNSSLGLQLYGMTSGFDGSSIYCFRFEVTFLLSENLAS